MTQLAANRKTVIPADDTCAVRLDTLIPPDEQIELVRQVLDKQKRMDLSVLGSCMRPWLKSGDSIEVRPLSGPPRVGIVVLLQRGHRLFAHRIVGLTRKGMLLSRGDLSPLMDPPAPRSAILGQVVAVRTRRGAVIRLDRTWVQQLGLRGAPVLRAVRAVWLRVAR